jgi:hypothetical protein
VIKSQINSPAAETKIAAKTTALNRAGFVTLAGEL